MYLEPVLPLILQPYERQPLIAKYDPNLRREYLELFSIESCLVVRISIYRSPRYNPLDLDGLQRPIVVSSL